jgi:NAD(P)H-hydrate epimerase
MQPLLTVAEMRAVDAAAQATTALDVLVGRAGTAVAAQALAMLGGAYGRRVTVVAGGGNNGADGRVAGALLAARGARVTVVEAGSTDRLGPCDLVIDAAYGTGFRGAYHPPTPVPGTPVLAVDIPSGVAGDTGEAAGPVLAADRTVTFAARKPGLVQGEGRRLAGRVVVADIGLDPGTARAHLVDDTDPARLVPARRPDDHKWSSAVLVVAGSPGMTGAAGLCARAAARAGAGMVRLGVPGAALGELPATEAVGVSLPADGWAEAALEASERCRAVIVGPGLGRDPSSAGEVRRLVEGTDLPTVVDADGLVALGRLDPGRPLRPEPTVVLTPHDGEYARLLDGPPGADRLAAARRLAAAAGSVALVKGSTTVVAAPDGRALVATAGSSRLATAGTGDVLSGVIGAFLARGVAPAEAAALAAHVHGRAAGRGRAEGLVAGDLPELVAAVLSELLDVPAGGGDRTPSGSAADGG